MIRRLFRGKTLASIGLFLGLSTGAVILLAKQWLINEVVSALEEEVIASCDCSLAFDSLSLSFSTLRARARNVRIVEKGVPRLSFKTITTKIDISEIRDRKVHLRNLILNDGTADGVGPNSVTFRFIDQLTKPLPPEKQLPDRWRVILDSLEVRKSFLRESFGSSEISGSGVSLSVKRDGEYYALTPRIADFRYTTYGDTPGSPPQELFLGPLAGSIMIEDAQTVFRSLTLGRDRSHIEATGVALSDQSSTFSGNTSFTVSPDYIGLPDWLRGLIIGNTTISGTLGSPLLTGSIQSSPDTAFSIALPFASQLNFPKLSGGLTIDVNRGDPVITLTDLNASNEQAVLTSTKPLKLSDAGLAAGFSAKVPRFEYGPFAVTKANATIDVTEGPAGVSTDITITSDDLLMQGFSLGPSRIQIHVSPTAADIAVESSNKQQGVLKWRGLIDLSSPDASLKDSSLSLVDYRYPLSLPVTKETLSPLAFTSQIALRGPLGLNTLLADGDITVRSPALHAGYPLSGRANLKDGVLRVTLPNSPLRAGAELTVDFAKSYEGKLRFTQPEVKLKEIVGHEDECSKVGASLSYTFPLQAILAGSGEVILHSLAIGCAPYSLSAPPESRIPIRNGALQLKNLSLATLESALELDGELGIAKGFAMSARGRLELSSLLPLLPAMDDLRGLLKTDVSIQGALSQPLVTGTAQLINGQFGVSSPELGGHHISGDFSLSGRAIRINKLGGSVNGGTFTASGTLLPFEPGNSSLRTELKEVTIEPIEDATITFSGDLALGVNQKQRQTLSGALDITFAEVAKDFDLNKLIMSTISGYFLPTRIQPAAKKSSVDLELDVAISAPRNIFVVTPFLSAELNTNLRARGTVTSPALEGSMQILSGWAGLKGNRFDITSGGLTFKPSSLIPHLELVGEGNLRAPTGESILVILDASGPLSAPKFSLNSDRGLSQSDLLLILTSSRPLGESTMKGRMDSQFGSDQRFFISDTSFSSFKAFFRNLTKLDILSFEPAYNQFTGTIEPAVVARKNISPRLTLLGESLFSSVSNSRAGGVYSLTPALDINAFFQTVSTQKNSILSSDLTYTVWSEESRFVTISIEGLNQFSEQSILNAARLGPSSRIANTPESLTLIQNQIATYMNEHGFTAASASVSCRSGDKFCHDLLITIQERQPSTVSGVIFEGDELSPELVQKVTSIAPIKTLATSSILASVERALVLSLRNEGYIAARITPSYRHDIVNHSSTLVVTSELRQAISFTFTGNKEFTEEDFLNSIDLFSRKRPFGNNTITLLIQNIERMYQEEGYLFAQVSHSEDRSDPERLVYRIAITEEAPVEIKTLSLIGNSHLSRSNLIKSMNSMGLKEHVAAMDATFAIPARLDALRDAIVSVYHHEGYPDAAASYDIRQREKSSSVDVVFTIQEGEPQRLNLGEVSGYPAGLNLPKPPSGQISLPRVNMYIDLLIESLSNEGFLSPAVFATPTDDYSAISVSVVPGQRTIVGSITYEGLVSISERTAARSTKLKPASPYRVEDINATKRELLRTGLFSRVEITAQDGAIDGANEALIIRVVERPMQTLELGLGANSEFGLHTFGEATNKSLFSDGRTLSLRVDTYFDQAQINPSGSGLISQGFTSLRYSDPSFLDSEYSLTEEVRYQRQELSTQEFNIDRLLVGSYLFRQIQNELAFSAGHSLVFDNLQDVTPGAVISDLDDGSVRLSFLSSIIKYDKRDDPLLPRSGYTVTVEPKVAFQQIASEANFGSLVAKSSAIIPLAGYGSRYSLGLGLSGGISKPWGDTEEIPITQRFYLGGRTTVRGFRENSLGPRGSDGAVIGGDAMIAGKTQLQYLADDSVSTHLFFDFGNVFLQHQDFDLEDLRTSVGVGFQYLSPIGPIGFDLGRPLDEKSGEPSVRIHFSVGSMF
ncbi:MAG: translocation/assembly module TamB domain-containing protein [Pseudomonadota bacterium]